MEDLLVLKERNIRITKNAYIRLEEQTLFKADGGEGLHLWESSILLSRVIYNNKSRFENKSIIELGSGCGLIGISCLKYTNCIKLTFSDYLDQILDNLVNNLKKNSLDHKHVQDEFPSSNDSNSELDYCPLCFKDRAGLLKLDWRDYQSYSGETYDFVIGSELVYIGGYIEELANTIAILLNENGVAIICMPKKRSMTEVFLNHLGNLNLKYNSYFIEQDESYFNQDLFTAPIDNEKESKKLFEDLKKMEILIYEIYK